MVGTMAHVFGLQECPFALQTCVPRRPDCALARQLVRLRTYRCFQRFGCHPTRGDTCTRAWDQKHFKYWLSKTPRFHAAKAWDQKHFEYWLSMTPRFHAALLARFYVPVTGPFAAKPRMARMESRSFKN